MVTQVGGVGVGAYLSLIGRRRGWGLGVGGKHFLGKLQHMGIRSRKKKPPLTGRKKDTVKFYKVSKGGARSSSTNTASLPGQTANQGFFVLHLKSGISRTLSKAYTCRPDQGLTKPFWKWNTFWTRVFDEKSPLSCILAIQVLTYLAG